MTQEQCERAVKALQEEGFEASHWEVFSAQTVDQVVGAPDKHGVWLENVWNADLQRATSFRIHDEEIQFWESHAPLS